MQIFDLHASKALARGGGEGGLFARYCYSDDFLYRESTWSARVETRACFSTRRLYL